VNRRIKVLIVDDSAIVRKVLSDTIATEPDMEVAGTAPDPYIARDKILSLHPDVLTLDIEMPRMDGLTFLRKLMAYYPMPVLIISSLGSASCDAAVEALRCGAVDVLAKPDGPYSVGRLSADLTSKIRAAAGARVRRAGAPAPAPALRHPARFLPGSLVAIGASTGGTEAIPTVLEKLPGDLCGVVVTQHIPPLFSAAFARRLNQLCALEVKEAGDGDEVSPGRAFVAPGGVHMLVRRAGAAYRIELRDGPPVCYQRPSVDVLFASVAEAAGNKAVGVLLTGMGSDGAQGLLRMKKAGARTIVQDEESCVVFGMPREAIRLGAADQQAPLSSIPAAILSAVS
jgi:two-component system, chemotaxis family, protein-glutamate methylesterase/glutaminase